MSRIKLLRVTTVPQSLYKLLEGQLHFMQKHYDVTAISSNGNLLEKVSKREGVTTFPIKMNRGISPLFDIVSIIRMIFFLVRLKPEIIHSHTPKAGLVSMIAGFVCGIPIRMHTVAGLPLESRKGLKRKVLLFAEKLTYRFSTNVYANSFGIYNFILDNSLVGESKVSVIKQGSSNGIDCGYFSKTPYLELESDKIRSELGIAPETFVFGFIGRLVKDKGINELVLAFSKLSNVNDIHLILVGKYEDELDPLLDKTTELINELPNISFVGYQNDVRPYFISFNTFVFPSYREGLPNVLLQAASLEVPIIASDCTGNTDIIKNNENGLLFTVGNEEELTVTMKKAIVGEDVKNYVVNARQLVELNYERVGLWEELYNEYERLRRI